MDRRRPGPLRDADAIALATATWLGAAIGWPVPRGASLALVVGGLATGRRVVVLVGALLLASGMGAAAERGLAPLEAAEVAGEMTLVRDPVPIGGGGVRVDVHHDGARLEAVAFGAEAAALRSRAAGDRVVLSGRRTPRPPDAPWLEVRHVRGRLQVVGVGPWRPGAPPHRLANGVRSVLARGAEPLPERLRPLYLGMLVGDDRGQQPRIVDDLRAAGLGHLLAVSGQNVAFVLAVARPIIARLAWRARLPATLGVLAVFVLVTRAEPSVLRATVMAGVAAVAVALGREASGLRLLALAVSGLVLVDPLLVRAAAFQLSVAATAGIVVAAAPIAERIPGPRPVAHAVGASLAAQGAVSPLLVAIFGGVPVAAVPANLVAAPAAAPVMMWGLTGGMVAGVVGGPVATMLQVPNRLTVGWVAAVGGAAGRLPVGELGSWHLAGLALAGAALWWGGRPSLRRAGALGCLAVAALPAVALATGVREGSEADQGVRVWHDRRATIVLVSAEAEPVGALAGLRRVGVRRIDLLVVTGAGDRSARVASVLEGRYPTGWRWDLRAPGPAVPPPGSVVALGPFEVLVVTGEGGVGIEVRRGDVRARPGV